MATQEQFMKVFQALENAYLLRMDKIGLALQGQIIKRTKQLKIRDKGDFVRNIDYEVVNFSPILELKLGSNVKHAKYVLGGKVPSATPFKPLKAWVKRKNLKWYDLEDKDKQLTVNQIANLIFWKIYHKGIEERNVVSEVLDNQHKWIKEQLGEVLDEF
jgi:hypothetical protein